MTHYYPGPPPWEGPWSGPSDVIPTLRTSIIERFQRTKRNLQNTENEAGRQVKNPDGNNAQSSLHHKER